MWPLGVALAAYALLAWRFDWLCDDAYISFRYARHLAEGVGLRFNLAPEPPVEGYSNFQWVVWLAAWKWIGVEPMLAARWSSAACGALLVAWTTRFATCRFELAPAAALACGLFLATLPPTAIWATSGLETMPTALFVFGCYERLLGDPERPRGMQAGVLGLLAALTRADGTLWIALLLCCAGLLWLVEGRPARLLRATLGAGAVLALGVGAHVAWRHAYYGDFVPNTAHVKAGFTAYRLERGFDYLAVYFLTLPSLALALLSALGRWERGLRAVWIPALAVVLATCAYSVWVGGDFMPMGRFLAPMLPFVALLFARALGGVRLPRSGAFLAASCVALSLAACFDLNAVPAAVRRKFDFRADRPVWESEISFWRSMKQRARDWDVQGRALARFVAPGESMILGAMGAISYYSDLTIYDTYGLVTPEVHRVAKPVQPSSPGHDLRVEPDVLLHHRPTYLGCMLVAASEPEGAGIPAFWLPRVDVERHPLPADEDFPPGLELRLLRLKP